MKPAIPLTHDFKSDSLLVINEHGRIKRLYVPFRVLCIHPSGKIFKDSWVYVQQISVNAQWQLIYLIAGEFHVYDSFRIYTSA